MGYEEHVGHPPDFEVRYRFFSPDEGGRRIGPPLQHYRSDWLYDGDIVAAGIHMIWPEFLAEDGTLVPDGVRVHTSGHAIMWIMTASMRTVHQARLHVGVRGFFMEGARRVAEAVVIRLIGLHSTSDG